MQALVCLCPNHDLSAFIGSIGHTDVGVTLKVYDHVFGEDAATTADSTSAVIYRAGTQET